MRSYLVFFLSIFLFLIFNNALADIVYEDWGDDSGSSSQQRYTQTRYSSGYGYEGDYNQNFQDPYDDSYYSPPPRKKYKSKKSQRASNSSSYSSRLPQQISGHGEKVIIIDPRVHAWGAYTADGTLLRSGTATAGSSYCRDLHRPCRTRSGTFRIFSLGNSSCYSRKFPLGRGGAPMPYCMFFNGGQGIHGSYEVANANLSHGCVRVHVGDAEWIRYNFAGVGTKVVVKPY